MTKLRATDRILATRAGDPKTMLEHVDGPDAKDVEYITSAEHWHAIAGTDPFIGNVQWGHETGNPNTGAPAESIRWNRDKNPGGVAIPSDSTVQPFTIKSGDEAARIHVQCLYSMVTGHLHKDVPVPPQLVEWFDDVWLPKVNHPEFPTVETVGDLNIRYTIGNEAYATWATWAWDATYTDQLIAKAGAWYPDLHEQNDFTIPVEPGTGETNMSVVFGNVPYPDVIASHFDTGNPWISYGAPDVPEAVVWHRMIGTWSGTDSYGHSGNFATSYGVSVKATDGIGGKIYEWIAPHTPYYGESSGPVSAPYGDGLALVNKVGIANVNRVTKAIEISGNYDTPLDADAKHAVAALTAYFADQKHIPWDQFPQIPGENRSFVTWHQEFTIGTGKVCPGEVVMEATPEMIEMTAAIMKGYQVSESPTPTPTPTPEPSTYAKPGWIPPADGKDHKDAKGNLFRAIDRVVFVKGGTRFYAQASLKSKETRAPAPPQGMSVRIAWKMNSWYVTPVGSRFKISDCDLAVTFKDTAE
jgi:hypothetical protein